MNKLAIKVFIVLTVFSQIGLANETNLTPAEVICRGRFLGNKAIDPIKGLNKALKDLDIEKVASVSPPTLISVENGFITKACVTVTFK